MRIHAKILDMKKAAGLAAAFLAFGAEGMTNVDASVAGYLPAPSRVDTSLFSWISAEGADDRFGYAFTRMIEAGKEDPDLRPEAGSAPTHGVTDPSVVFLLSERSNGTYSTGTGTIIKGSDGKGRVLTAAHVLFPKDGMTLTKVVAFDGQGRALAEVSPVMSYFDATRRAGFHASNVMNDIAVAEPVAFFSAEDSSAWNARGVRIAQDQPAHPLFMATAHGTTALNGGMSGATLRNASDEVVGIITHAVPIEIEHAQISGSAFIEAMIKQDVRNEFSDPVASLLLGRQQTASRINDVAAAAPILNPEILEALRVFGVDANPNIGAFEARFSGFPVYDGVSGHAFVTPMVDYEAETFIKEAFVVRHGGDLMAALQ